MQRLQAKHGPGLDPGVATGSYKKTRQYKKISRLLISIKPEAPAMVLMKAVASRRARYALD
ncbi:hypothetical protein [Bradyrhizobium sp.]|uniref:hypothetical protein n=1 Tax=Bradyrhizobium sp. TaxID=376 RepID=UPI0025C5F161|nr:hypothetical protein [Bradyrhizobium sp.]